MLPITEQLATIYVRGYEAIYAGSDTITIPSNAIDFNGFKIWRSPNNVATTIAYHWPNEDGTMGELRAIEVLDAQYRYASRMNTNYNSNNGLVFIPKSDIVISNVSKDVEFPDNATTNEDICLIYKRAYIDNTAKYNTDEIVRMSFTANNEPITNGATIARGLTAGNIEWSVPNVFQCIVIGICSDKIDDLDPTFNDNKGKGLGYKSTNGRFNFPGSDYSASWSSTYTSGNLINSVDGIAESSGKLRVGEGFSNSERFIFPVHELTIV